MNVDTYPLERRVQMPKRIDFDLIDLRTTHTGRLHPVGYFGCLSFESGLDPVDFRGRQIGDQPGRDIGSCLCFVMDQTALQKGPERLFI